MTDTDTVYCANHPDRETYLRCNKCDKPICVSCAVQTPTGYRCKECVRGQQKIFNTANTLDLILAPLIAGVISFIGANVVGYLGFYTVFASPFVGILIEVVVRRVIKNRRSNTLFLLTAGGAALGGLIPFLSSFFIFMRYFSMETMGFFGILPLAYEVIYTILVTSTVYYRLKGISFK